MEEQTEPKSEEKTSNYGKRPLWQWIVLYVIIGAVVYGVIYYFVFAKKGGYNYNQSGTQYPTNTQQTTTQPSPAVSPAVSSSASAPMKITVSGSEFAFTPSAITVKIGQQVQLTFKNSGTYAHNLTIADLNVQTKTIQPGQEDTVTFTPTKTGIFSFVCTIDSHADRGMKGTITVQ